MNRFFVCFNKMLRTSICSKPWPTDSQVDSSQNKFLTCVQLEFRLPTHLRGIETTCVDFGRAQIFAQVDAGFSPFGHQTQVITSWSQVIFMHAWNLRLYATCMNLRADLRIRLANHRKSVRCLLGFGNLRRLASPFGQPSQVRTMFTWLWKLASTCKSVWPRRKFWHVKWGRRSKWNNQKLV